MHARYVFPSPILSLLLLLLAPPWLEAVEFIQYPSDVNAALGTNVTLECVANETILVWEINSLQLLDPANIDSALQGGLVLELGTTETVGDNYRTTITIPAGEYVNDTITGIKCQAGPSEFKLEDGPTFNFSVYGLPLAPGEVEVRGDTAHQLSLSWTPPFTLPGETVSYSLIIEDQTTGERETVAPLTDTNYTHTLSESEALVCHPFLFSVFSVNDVGLSLNSSSAPPSLHPSGPGPLGVVQTGVVHDSQAQSGLRATVNLLFQSPVSCFSLMYNVSLHDELASTDLQLSPSATTVDDSVAVEVTGLRENTRYTATLSAYNHFIFSSDSPIQSEIISFVTSGLQSVDVLHYNINDTLRITCTFAEGTSSTGCRVTVMIDGDDFTINVNRDGGDLEVVHYDSSMRGAPSAVQAQDLGVEAPLVITGSVSSEGDPTPSTDTTSRGPTTVPPTVNSSVTTPTTEATAASSPNLLTWAIPAGVGVAVLLLLVLIACCLVCCRLRSSKYHASRRDTLPHSLHLPHSPSSPSSTHDYKQVPPHVTGTIKEMSFNPLYGDAPPQTFDPPLPSPPQPSNGHTHDTITLPSNLPPVYEEVSAARQAAKLAANPQYGAVGGAKGGGANGATPNPQYSTSPGGRLEKPAPEEHMYASLKEPGVVTAQQKQYAQPYEHVQSSKAPPPGGVVIKTDDNVSYNASSNASVSSPQKSL